MERLAHILSRIRVPGPGPLEVAELERAVATVLGPRAADLRVASYRRGRLTLEVGSAARAFEYQAFERTQLLSELQRRPGLEKLSDIRFQTGQTGSGRRHARE